MNLPNDVNYEDVTVNATVTGVEKAKVQATAYFTPPTEETKHIHERMLQMCLDDLNEKMEKRHGKSSTCKRRISIRISESKIYPLFLCAHRKEHRKLTQNPEKNR